MNDWIRKCISQLFVSNIMNINDECRMIEMSPITFTLKKQQWNSINAAAYLQQTKFWNIFEEITALTSIEVEMGGKHI